MRFWGSRSFNSFRMYLLFFKTQVACFTILISFFAKKYFNQEFKLNPGAKTFSPSSAQQRSMPSVVPAVTSVAYMTEASPVVSISAAQPEVGTSPLVPRSLPVKYVPYGGLVSSNGETEMQYSQPVSI